MSLVCLRMPLPLSSWQGALITAGIIAYAVFMIWLLRRLIIHSRPWWAFVVSVVFVSPVPLAIIAWAAEHRPPWVTLDPNRMSWAALFGDVALGALIGVCAYAWAAMPLGMQVRYKSTGRSRPGHGARIPWLVISLMWGLLLAGAFRAREAGVYDLYRFMSYTKLIHDYVAYVVLATMVIFAAWPVLRRKLIEMTVWQQVLIKLLVVALLGVWVGGLVHDAHGLSPAFLHPKTPSAEQFDPHPTDVLARNACKVPGR